MSDVVDALIKLIDRSESVGEIFNIGSTEEAMKSARPSRPGAHRIELRDCAFLMTRPVKTSSSVFNSAITMFWLVGITNAVNTIDNMASQPAWRSSRRCFSL